MLLNGARPRVLNVLDVFCGAGGGTDATREAAAMAGRPTKFTLINHWEVACATASLNFPGARVICSPVESVIAQHLYLRGQLDILQGGPECIEFSRAAGKKPKNYQYRATPWCMVRIAEALLPKIVMIENVPEFEKKWRPFKAWVEAFKAIGYVGEWRKFNAADYGDPTTRERLFMLFVRRPLKVVWALPTHDEFGRFGLEPWRDAENHVIDWTKKGRWLDEMPGQKRYGGLPLSPKTFVRIYDGLRKGGVTPLVVTFDNKSSKAGARPASRPLSTITSKARHAIAEPYFVKLRGTGKSASLKKPAPTVTAGGMHLAVVEPSLIHTAHGGKRGAKSIKGPVPTIATDGACFLVEPFFVKYYGTGKSGSIKKPLPTVTTKDRFALCCPVVIKDGKMARVRIRWRILEPHELAAAQGFRRDFRFCGAVRKRGKIVAIRENANKGDVVKQIGNAWPHNLARALMLAVLTQRADIRPFLAKLKEAA